MFTTLSLSAVLNLADPMLEKGAGAASSLETGSAEDVGRPQ